MRLPFGAAKKRRRAIRTFADKLGLIDFGVVDQHNDEHHLVRGFSLSPSHKDSSYTVGTFEDFDLVLVDRSDKGNRWFICDINLTKDSVPHLFLLPRHQRDTDYEKVLRNRRTLEPMTLPLEHSTEFSSRYELFFTPEHTAQVEELFTPKVTRAIAAHFWPLAIEVWDGRLFIYSTEPILTQHHLETIIKNGTWLAQVLTSEDR